MAQKKTGLDKFMEKQFGGHGVKIGSPASERELPNSDYRSDNERAAETSGGKAKAGRPARTEKPEMATVIIKMDRELKRKLEEVKYISYKSSLKDVIIEAANDIIKKYGVE